MEQGKPATTAEEKRRYARLCNVAPQSAPKGWEGSLRPVRLNGYEKPGVFASIYTNSFLRLVFQSEPGSLTISITLSHLNGIAPLPHHIDEVKAAFFSERNVEVTGPAGGLVYFALSG